MYQPTEPIFAIRGWKKNDPNKAPYGYQRPIPGLLRCTGLNFCWSGPEIQAIHYSGPANYPWVYLPHKVEETPVKDCTCGIHAYSTLEAAQRSMYTSAKDVMLGVILIWGRILAAPLLDGDGIRYRAQNARIIALENSEIAKEAAEAYNLPQFPREGLLWYAREHGQALPTEVFEDKGVSQ